MGALGVPASVLGLRRGSAIRCPPCAQVPFQGRHTAAIFYAVLVSGERPPLAAFEAYLAAPQATQTERSAVRHYMALMQSCWAEDPAQRPSFKGVRCCRRRVQTGFQAVRWAC